MNNEKITTKSLGKKLIKNLYEITKECINNKSELPKTQYSPYTVFDISYLQINSVDKERLRNMGINTSRELSQYTRVELVNIVSCIMDLDKLQEKGYIKYYGN